MSLNPRRTEKNYRIVVMGAAGVGKTSILSRFIHNKFPERHKATVEELHHHVFRFETSEAEVDILDTSGTYEFPAMRKLAIATGDAFLLVYSPDVENSFALISSYRDEIVQEIKAGDCRIIVVQNKIDLLETKELDKEVEIESVCDRYKVTGDWECTLICTSAKTGENIASVFQTLEDKIRLRAKQDEKRMSVFRRTSVPALHIPKHIPRRRSKSKSRNLSVN